MTEPDRARSPSAGGEAEGGAEGARRELFERAAAELHAAQTLVADPLSGPRCAAPHLVRLWQHLAWQSRGEVPAQLGESPSDWLAPAHVELVPPRLRAGLFASLRAAHAHARAPSIRPEGDELPGLSRPRVLLAELDALARVLRALEREAGGRSLAAQRRVRWAARAGRGLVGLSLLVTLAWRPWRATDIGPWRGTYYPSKIFEGRPDVQRERDVAFDWGEQPPTESIPTDFYSARFDSCLMVEAPTEVAFMLVSDNGSRLFVDGELRIDNWAARQSSPVAGARMTLGVGVHHLRVEYFEDRGEARLHLTASFDESSPPGPIPAERLVFPGLELDEPDPCAS
jgi:hypothetical protein